MEIISPQSCPISAVNATLGLVDKRCILFHPFLTCMQLTYCMCCLCAYRCVLVCVLIYKKKKKIKTNRNIAPLVFKDFTLYLQVWHERVILKYFCEKLGGSSWWGDLGTSQVSPKADRGDSEWTIYSNMPIWASSTKPLTQNCSIM